jgi:hypothetical protein
MIKLFTLLLFTFFFSALFGQTPHSVNLIDSLLKAGTFKAVTISYDYPKHIKELQTKVLKNLRSNPEWANKYIVRIIEKGAKDLSYVDAMGLTKDEYNELALGFKKDKDIIIGDTLKFIIKKINGTFTFSAIKIATAFNKLKIDTKKKEITYGNLKLTKELQANGQKSFAPLLQGFEAYWAESIGIKSENETVGSFGLCIGINSGDNKPTLCLIRKINSSPEPEIFTISIL